MEKTQKDARERLQDSLREICNDQVRLGVRGPKDLYRKMVDIVHDDLYEAMWKRGD